MLSRSKAASAPSSAAQSLETPPGRPLCILGGPPLALASLAHTLIGIGSSSAQFPGPDDSGLEQFLRSVEVGGGGFGDSLMLFGKIEFRKGRLSRVGLTSASPLKG